MKPDSQPRPLTEHDLDYGPTLRGFREGMRVFERYTLLSMLGRGGMGVVWLAEDERLQVKVALKFLPEQLQNDRAAIDDLRRETRRCLALTHPHIVRIHDLAESPEAAAIAMEFVDGHTLTDLRLEKPQRCFEVAEVTPWLRQVAEGLSYAHAEARIVHRDLKPTNLMLTHEGRIKIADFGIASHMQDTLSRTAMTQVAAGSGTPCYMSPQQFAGKPPAVTDDIYALGATLYELLTGKPPFYTGNIQHQLQYETPPSVAERRQELHVESTEVILPAWEKTLAACLDKDATRRPQSVGEVVERLLSAEPRAQSQDGNAENPPRPQSSKAMLVAAVVAVTAVVAGITMWQMKKTGEAPAKSPVAQQPETPQAPSNQPKPPAAPETKPTEVLSRKLFYLTGKGDDDGNSLVADLGKQKGFEAGPLNLANVSTIPMDADAVLLVGLKFDLTDRELNVLQNYWQRTRAGMLVLLDPNGDTPRLHGFLQANGIRPRDDRVLTMENTSSGMKKQFNVPVGFPPGSLLSQALTTDTTVFSGQTQSLELLPVEAALRAQGVQISMLATASERYWAEKRYLEESPQLNPEDVAQPVCIVAGVERGREARMMVVGNALAVATTNTNSFHRDLMTAALSWIQPRTNTIASAQNANANSLQNATKDRPYVNSLGMKFVPVKITGGPTSGQSVLFSIWETRRQDYAAYAAKNSGVNGEWKAQELEGVPIGQKDDEPVVSVSWEDAVAFCAWLTETERAAGHIGVNDEYRLPSDHEWSCAVGIGDREAALAKAWEKQPIADVYPWGLSYPPPANNGNYGDETALKKFSDKHINPNIIIAGYSDGYATTAPVGSYEANHYGIYDLGGNVFEWCKDWVDEPGLHILRGGCWHVTIRDILLSSGRSGSKPDDRSPEHGFRCVLTLASTSPRLLPLTTDKPSYRSGEAVRCTMQVPVDGHLRVYSIDAKGDVTQIFPNRFEPDDRVKAGATVQVPGNSAYDLTLELPQGLSRGTETIHAVLSPEEFAPDASPLAQGEDFRSLGRVTPEQLRTRGLKVTAKPQTSVGSVSYEVLP